MKLQRVAPAIFFSVLQGAYAPAASPQVPVFPSESLGLPSPAGDHRLGARVRLTDDWLMSGVDAYDGALGNEGAVFLWPRMGASNFGAPVLVPSPSPSVSGRFGHAVALGPMDSFFVGEDRSDFGGTSFRETVHRFERQGAGWIRTDSVNDASFGFSGFGQSLDVSGNVLVVGAPLAGNLGPLSGAAHVYRVVSGALQLEETLTAFDGAQGNRFGTSVAVDGNRIVVGAPLRLEAGLPVGAAYVYEFQAGAWAMTGRLSVDPASNDRALGVSVSIDGDSVAVGAARTNDKGAAYVFRDAGAGWQLEERLSPDNLGFAATFGHSLRILGNTLVVGAYQDSVVGQFGGSAWTFERTGTNWEPRTRAVNEGPATFHGFSVAIDAAGTVVVGRPTGFVPGAPIGSGAIGVYPKLESIGDIYCTALPNSTGRMGQTFALGSDVVAGNRVTLVAAQLPRSSFGYFLCSRATGFVALAGGSQGNLCLGGEIGRYVGAGEIQNTAGIGYFELSINLGAMPSPTGFVTATPGETWHFQVWHRDSIQGALTSNFTEAVSVLLQ